MLAGAPHPHDGCAQGIVVFKIDDAEWSLDLSEGSSGALYEGPPAEGAKPDLTLTTSDATFAQMVMGKVNPQTVRPGGGAGGG